MEYDVLKQANQGLAEKVESLSVQVAKQEKMLTLCFEVITQFGHFVPNMIEEFQSEINKIKEESYVDVEQKGQGESQG